MTGHMINRVGGIELDIINTSTAIALLISNVTLRALSIQMT